MPIDQIAKIIEETLLRFGKDAKYSDYCEVAHELFPDEMLAMSESFARNGFTKWLKAGMRRAVNIDEQDPDAPQIQLDLVPGLAAPAYIDLGTHGTPKPVRFADCTVHDLDIAIATRSTVISRVAARKEDMQMKREWLAANSRSEVDTVGDVVQRLSGGGTGHSRSVGDEDRPTA